MSETDSTTSQEFIGQFPQAQRLSFARYMVSLPSYEVGRTLMIEGRLRDRSLLAIDWDKETNKQVVKERSFRNVSGHDLTVTGTLHSICDLFGLPGEVRLLADLTGYAHDTTKPTEIVARAYRVISKDIEPSSTYSLEEKEYARRVLESWFSFYDLPSTDLITKLEDSDILGFEKLFNQRVNIPILKKLLRDKVQKQTQEEIVGIASCDMWDAFPKIIAITRKYLESAQIPADKVAQFKDFADRLDAQGKLPETQLTEANEVLAMLLWYCDGISSRFKINENGEEKFVDAITTVDRRIDELAARGGPYYVELNQGSAQYYGGDDILELYRLVNHAIEEVIKTRLVVAGKMEASRPATDVPIVIFQHLTQLVDNFIKQKS